MHVKGAGDGMAGVVPGGTGFSNTRLRDGTRCLLHADSTAVCYWHPTYASFMQKVIGHTAGTQILNEDCPGGNSGSLSKFPRWSIFSPGDSVIHIS